MKSDFTVIVLGILVFYSCFLTRTSCNQQRDYENVGTVKVEPTVGQPWPKPQIYQVQQTYMNIDKQNFEFTVSQKTCDILDAAIQRYYKTIFYPEDGRVKRSVLRFEPEERKPSLVVDSDYHGILQSLNVFLTNDCEDLPAMNMDEQYEIKIDNADYPGKGILTSDSIWGILRGLETFSQIIYESTEGLLRINSTFIDDHPRFSHRGILLDTSRHFVNKAVLLKNLDTMAYNKLNVFHWHIVDDHSFPYESYLFPDLSAKGAFQAYTHVYTQEDVLEIIEYARMRGIRVVPEFDTPGHTQSWGPGMPGLLTPCYDKHGQPDGTYGPVDPTVNSTYKFFAKFLSEVVDVFPDKYVHLGGDEVSFNCWKSNPKITSFMKKMGFGKDYAKLEQYYIQNVLNTMQTLKHGYIVWQEVVDNKVKVAHDTVVQVWKEPHKLEMTYVTWLGFNTLLSSCWYLSTINPGADWHDYYNCDPESFIGEPLTTSMWVFGGLECPKVKPDTIVQVWKDKDRDAEMSYVTGLGLSTLLSSCWYLSHITTDKDWPEKYTCEPLKFNGTEKQKQLVKGGEACLWGEYVDGTNLLSRLWPRASAVAERLWSAQSVDDVDEASHRLEEHRCRMVRRGIPAEPPNGPGFCQYEIQP